MNISENIAKNGLLFQVSVKEEGTDDVRNLLLKLNYLTNEMDKVVKELNSKKISFNVEIEKCNKDE